MEWWRWQNVCKNFHFTEGVVPGKMANCVSNHVRNYLNALFAWQLRITIAVLWGRLPTPTNNDPCVCHLTIRPAWGKSSNVKPLLLKSEVVHKWAEWLHNLCRLGVPNASERGTKSAMAHKWADWLRPPVLFGGSPTLQTGG